MKALFIYARTENPHRDEIGGPRLALTYDSELRYLGELVTLLQPKLLAKETVGQIVESCCLVEDEFDGNDSYTVRSAAYRDFGLVYTFEVGARFVEVHFEIQTIQVA